MTTVSNIHTGEAGHHDSPTQMLTTRKTATVVDARGRRITVRPLNALEHYRLAEIGSSSGNQTAANYEIMAASVTEIDGDGEAFPGNKLHIEVMIQRLDFDGLAAVAEGLKQCSDGDTENAAKK